MAMDKNGGGGEIEEPPWLCYVADVAAHTPSHPCSYLLSALHISMVTRTDKAMVIGTGDSKISQSRPSK